MTQPVRAAAYLRRSTLRQEDSLERQQGAVLPFAAARGLEVIATYEDSRPGDEFDKRPGLQALLADAKAGKFKIILVDEPSRLSRQDVIEFFELIVAPLRRAGVEVQSVKYGRHSWDDLPGLILTVVQKHGDRDEPVRLAGRAADGLLKAARERRWLGGSVLFGYRVALDPDGKKYLLIDAEAGPIVRSLFEWYGNEGLSLRQISERLAGRGVAPPRWREGRKSASWSRVCIGKLLRNPCYLGTRWWNRRHTGKYAAVVNGAAVIGAVPPTPNPREDWVPAGACPALVDQDLFDRVQRRLTENRKNTTPVRDHDYLLTGLLVCGRCDSRMVGKRYRDGVKYYVCGQYSLCGKHACWGATAREDETLQGILDTLRGGYLSEENLRRLRRLEAEMDRDHRTKAPAEIDRLRKRVAELNADLDATLRKWLHLPPELGAELVAKMTAWQQERGRAEERLAVLRSRPERQELAGKVEALETLRGRMEKALADPPALRLWLLDTVKRVTLWYEPRGCAGRGGRQNYVLRRALVTTKADPDLDLSFYLETTPSRALQVENIWTLDIA